MKKSSLVTLLFFSTALYFLFTSSSNGRATAANAGNTGAPGESQLCGNCHNGGAFGPVTVSIQVFQAGTTTPAPGYFPGQNYDVRVTVQNNSGNPGGYGFQLTCLTSIGNNPLAGYFNLASNVKQKLVTTGAFNGRTYVEHNGVLPNNQFNFSWTAPTAGTGNVTFYSAGNAVNGTGSTGGDNGGSASLVFPEIQALVVTSSTQNLTCANLNNGSIDLQVTGGLNPITYLWNDGAVTQDRQSISAGNYSVQVTDAAGQSQSLNFTLTAPEPIEIQITTQDPASFGQNGSFSFQVLSGTEPINTEVIPAVDPMNAPDGDYEIIATDALNCTYSFPFSIVGPDDITVESEIQHVSCFELSNGSITLEVFGGVPPYSFAWTGGAITQNITNLSAGNYSVLITDASNYQKSFDFVIEQPELLSGFVAPDAIACFGESTEVVVSASGGTAPYIGTGTFTSEAGLFNAVITDQQGCQVTVLVEIEEPSEFVITATTEPISCSNESGEIIFVAEGGTEPYQFFEEIVQINNPGMYSYTFIDNNGCQETINVEVPALDGFTILSSLNSALCNDACDGSAELFSPDATSNVTFTWPDNIVASNRNDLCAGNYTVVGSDENGCLITANVTIQEPTALEYSIENIIEEGVDIGFVEVQANGGTAPYEYSWSTGAIGNSAAIPVNENHFVTITDANGCELTTENFFIFLGLEELNVSFSIYPNPADETLVVSTERSFGSDTRLTIFDLSGKILKHENTSTFPYFINVSEIPVGFYLLEISTSKGTIRERISIR